MAIIMPPIPLPLRDVEWDLPPSAQSNKSGWTGTSKSVGLPGGQNWTASGTFRTLVGQDRAKPWRAFFVQISQPFQKFPVIAVEAQQTTAANPAVRAGAGNANTVPLQGLPLNKTVLDTGDMMTVFLPSGHRRLVCLTAPLASNGQGQGTATFGPELGEIPVAGAQVEIQWPYGLMRQAAGSGPRGWKVTVGHVYSFALAMEEAR